MSPLKMNILVRQNLPTLPVATAGIILPAVIGGVLGSDFVPDELAVLARFLVFFYAAILAFATPWILFPLQSLYVYQALNPAPIRLLWILILRMLTILLPAVVLLASALAGHDDFGYRMQLIAENAAILLGLTTFAGWRYMRMGRVSQLWQEGIRGASFMAAMREAGSTYGMPAGSYPTIGATMSVAVAGMMAVVAGAWLSGTTGLPLQAIGGGLLFVVGLVGWRNTWRRLDTEFYHTHGFYSELFRNPGGRSDGGRDPIPVQALYWVPGNIRTLVWITLRQMDRKIPAGRLLISLYALIWVVIYGNLGQYELILGSVGALVLGKNLLIWRMDNTIFFPVRFKQRIGTQLQWFWSGVFVNLRWSLPLLLLHAITMYFVEMVTFESLVFWIRIDVVTLVLIPLILALRTILRQNYEYR